MSDRRWRGLARGARQIAALGFSLQFVALDLVFRSAAYRSAGAWLAAALSVVVSRLAYDAAERRGARIAIAIVTAIVLVVQGVCFSFYRAPLDAQVLASAIHAWVDVRRAVVPNLPLALGLVVVVATIELGWLGWRRASLAARPRWALGAIAVGLVAFGPRLSEATPEMRMVDGVRALGRTREAPIVGSVSLPALPSRRATTPNVLLVVTESVRATEYCGAPNERCDVAPAIHALLPNRIAFKQMRAVSSYTAIAIGALFTGRTQEVPRAELAAMPNLFDWARAVRSGGARMRAAYWASQSDTIWERADPKTMADDFVTLETLTGRRYDDDPADSGFDRLLSAHLDRAMPALSGSHFAVVHWFSTHAPYFVEPADAPFGPWSNVVTWSGMPALLNAYRDSIHEQDKLVARSVKQFIDAQGTRPWVVFFTSDHGEAFGEHSAIHHGQNLYDEQIHVPAWIAWGNGAISASEEANLRAWSDAFPTHLDVVPTLLDVWGVLDSLPMAALRESLDGRSLLRPVVPMKKALPITNCTQMFPCPVNAWGMLRDRFELHAQVWDPEWTCVDLARADAARPEDDAECARLREASRAYYPTLPNRKPNR